MDMDVKKLKETYVKGMRLRLTGKIAGESPRFEKGLCGTIRGVDDAGNILMSWDNGSSLSVLPDIDSFEVISPQGRPVEDEAVDAIRTIGDVFRKVFPDRENPIYDGGHYKNNVFEAGFFTSEKCDYEYCFKWRGVTFMWDDYIGPGKLCCSKDLESYDLQVMTSECIISLFEDYKMASENICRIPVPGGNIVARSSGYECEGIPGITVDYVADDSSQLHALCLAEMYNNADFEKDGTFQVAVYPKMGDVIGEGRLNVAIDESMLLIRCDADEDALLAMAYSFYKEAWKKAHGCAEKTEEELEKEGMIYACFDEFLDCEYKDEAYMQEILPAALFEKYKECREKE